MSVIQAIVDYIDDYTGLATGAPVWVDALHQEPDSYSIVPLPGESIIETYLDKSTARAYPFAFQLQGSTADDAARLQNAGFCESFAAWLESQTEDGVLPTLDTGKTATEIRAASQGFLQEQGESGTAIYYIPCVLYYDQDAPTEGA